MDSDRRASLRLLALLVPFCLSIINLQNNCFLHNRAYLPVVISSIYGAVTSISLAYKTCQNLEPMEVFVLVAMPIFVLVCVGAMLFILGIQLSLVF